MALVSVSEEKII